MGVGVRHQREQQELDSSHVSSVRGEHRYPDAHQTIAERHSRRERDDLKRRLAAASGQLDRLLGASLFLILLLAAVVAFARL
jgi:hypothetical protein